MLEYQYRQEVEREIQAKVDMENEIRYLKDMIAGIEGSKQPSKMGQDSVKDD